MSVSSSLGQEIQRNQDGDIIIKYQDGSWRYVLPSDSTNLKEELQGFIQEELKKSSTQSYKPKFHINNTIPKMDNECPCLFDGIAYQCSELKLLQAYQFVQKTPYTLEVFASAEVEEKNLLFHIHCNRKEFQQMLEVGQGITMNFSLLNGINFQKTVQITKVNHHWATITCSLTEEEHKILASQYLDKLGVRWPWGYIKHNILHVNTLKRLTSCFKN